MGLEQGFNEAKLFRPGSAMGRHSSLARSGMQDAASYRAVQGWAVLCCAPTRIVAVCLEVSDSPKVLSYMDACFCDCDEAQLVPSFFFFWLGLPGCFWDVGSAVS